MTTYSRSGPWTYIRTAEWVTLGAAVLLAVADTLQTQGHDLVAPWVLTAAALASKVLRAVLAITKGLPSSTVSPVSYLIAALLAGAVSVAQVSGGGHDAASVPVGSVLDAGLDAGDNGGQPAGHPSGADLPSAGAAQEGVTP
jgi:hypothetical protein